MSTITRIRPPVLQFNIRSFHPEKSFGWSGLMFRGDDRGFSNKPSGTGSVRSRIWHLFNIDTANNASRITNITRSDPSKAFWSDTLRTYGGSLAPKSVMMPLQARRTGDKITSYRIKGRYSGVNHAMPGSVKMQQMIGTSYVPALDVQYQIEVIVDDRNMHVDIITEVSGDGFPNCEAFVVDARGHSVFLGTHVRIGAAPITLALNQGYKMIGSAIRLPIDVQGNFSGTIGDELSRNKHKESKLKFQSISSWNQIFLRADPNRGHCMVLEKASLEGCF